MGWERPLGRDNDSHVCLSTSEALWRRRLPTLAAGASHYPRPVSPQRLSPLLRRFSPGPWIAFLHTTWRPSLGSWQPSEISAVCLYSSSPALCLMNSTRGPLPAPAVSWAEVGAPHLFHPLGIRSGAAWGPISDSRFPLFCSVFWLFLGTVSSVPVIPSSLEAEIPA